MQVPQDVNGVRKAPPEGVARRVQRGRPTAASANQCTCYQATVRPDSPPVGEGNGRCPIPKGASNGKCGCASLGQLGQEDPALELSTDGVTGQLGHNY